jgi:hypothetical protein
MPFDRHNWLVDRCGDEVCPFASILISKDLNFLLEVTYIIDYYDVGEVNPETKLFTHLDVRPAIRDFDSFWCRTVVGYWYIVSFRFEKQFYFY